MNEAGISFNDAFLLVENYTLELDWLMEIVYRNIEKNNIRHELMLSNSIAVSRQLGTKKGNSAYSTWRQTKINKLTELMQPIKKKTIFDKLKDKRKDNTVFGKLKHFKKRGIL